jgi:hypothetical protein
MERRGGIEVEIDKTSYLNGLKIEAYHTEDAFKGASDTALHEAKHVVAGIDDGAMVEKVSVIPGPGYLGLTQFNRFTSAGAAAPHADGHSGTSWDVSIIEMSGESVMGASVRGRNSILRKAKHVRKIAQELDKRGTLHGPEVAQIYRELEEGEEIRIDITHNSGDKKSFSTRTNEQNVFVPSHELSKLS